MNPTLITRIADLLNQAGSAHHHFEQTVLKGVYDEEWPDWYAGHLLEHGLNDLLPHPVTRAELGEFLFHNNETRRQQQPEPDWTDYTAREMITRFGNSAQN